MPFSQNNEVDASITNKGASFTQNIAVSEIFDSDIVDELDIIPIFFVSTLSRTMQTAYYLILGLNELGINGFSIPIVIIPHIEEIPSITGLDFNNQPQNFHKNPHFDIIPKNYRDHSINKVKSAGFNSKAINVKSAGFNQVNFYRQLSPYNNKGDPVVKTNVNDFYNMTLPMLIDILIKQGYLSKKDAYNPNSRKTIVIVSHGAYIKKATGIRLENTGAVLQPFIYNDDKQLELFESELIFKGMHKKESIKGITKDDLELCSFNN